MKIFSSKLFWLIIAGSMVAMVTTTVLLLRQNATVTQTPVENVEWCLIHEFDGSGGYFGEDTAGEYQYEVIVTQDGVKVYQKCSKQ